MKIMYYFDCVAKLKQLLYGDVSLFFFWRKVAIIHYLPGLDKLNEHMRRELVNVEANKYSSDAIYSVQHKA